MATSVRSIDVFNAIMASPKPNAPYQPFWHSSYLFWISAASFCNSSTEGISGKRFFVHHAFLLFHSCSYHEYFVMVSSCLCFLIILFFHGWNNPLYSVSFPVGVWGYFGSDDKWLQFPLLLFSTISLSFVFLSIPYELLVMRVCIYPRMSVQARLLTPSPQGPFQSPIRPPWQLKMRTEW